MGVDAAKRRQLADRLRALAFHILKERNCQSGRKSHVELSRDESQCPRRHVLYDRPFDAVEIRPIPLPVIGVSRHLDRLVQLELYEFERAGADRVSAHVAPRYMA